MTSPQKNVLWPGPSCFRQLPGLWNTSLEGGKSGGPSGSSLQFAIENGPVIVDWQMNYSCFARFAHELSLIYEFIAWWCAISLWIPDGNLLVFTVLILGWPAMAAIPPTSMWIWVGFIPSHDRVENALWNMIFDMFFLMALMSVSVCQSMTWWLHEWLVSWLIRVNCNHYLVVFQDGYGKTCLIAKQNANGPWSIA